MFVDTINVISTPSSEWYDDIKFYLTHGYYPPALYFKKHRNLRLNIAPYQFIDNVLFQKKYDGVFLICLENTEVNKVLFELHAGPAVGHFS